MSFPSSPTNNQIYVYNNQTYKYDLTNKYWIKQEDIITQDIIPISSSTYNIGSNSNKINNIYTNNLISTGITSTTATINGVLISGNAISGQVLQATSTSGATWTTPSVFSGATSGTSGTTGYVPAPAIGKQNAYLKGDGTWSDLLTSDLAYYSRFLTNASDLPAPSNAVPIPFANIGSSFGSGITYSNGFFGITNSSDRTQQYEVEFGGLSVHFSAAGFAQYGIYAGSSSSVIGSIVSESIVSINSEYRTTTIFESKQGPSRCVVSVTAGATIYIAAAFISSLNTQYLWNGRLSIQQLPLKTVTSFIPATDATIIEWTNYTPTIAGSTTNPALATTKTLKARYRVVGKNLQLSITYYAASATGSAAGSGAYLFSLPAGLTIDTTLASAASVVNSTQGSFAGFDASVVGSGMIGYASNSASCLVVPASTTSVSLVLTTPVGGTNYNCMVGSGNFSITFANCFYKFIAEIPIIG